MTDYPLMQWTPERIQAFWDYESRFPQRYYTYIAGGELVARLSRHIRRSESVLDYACGAGHLTRHLLARGFRVTATDLSPQSLARVETEFGAAANFEGAVTTQELLASGRTFGTIFACELIEHLDDATLAEVVSQLRCLSAPDTSVIFSTRNSEKLEDLNVLCPCCRQVFHRWQHVRSWTPDSLSAYLGAHGLPVSECFSSDFTVAPPYAKRTLGRRWKQFKLRAGLRRKGPDLIAICRVPSA